MCFITFRTPIILTNCLQKKRRLRRSHQKLKRTSHRYCTQDRHVNVLVIKYLISNEGHYEHLILQSSETVYPNTMV